MRISLKSRFVASMMLSMLWGCAANQANVPQVIQPPPPQENVEPRRTVSDERKTARKTPVRAGWSTRVLTEGELRKLGESDPELSPSVSMGILARINVRARYYIAEDIKNGRPLKVPYDFSSFKNWSPMPEQISLLSELPKFVLIVKDIPFIAWYEEGRRIGDAEVCIGKETSTTDSGIYTVKDKDANHFSRSYSNAYGQPAPMPWALRIYDHVWIHTGDITSGYCSHGCINLPLMPSRDLFHWADKSTVVMILESLKDLSGVLASNRSSCLLFPEECAAREHAGGR